VFSRGFFHGLEVVDRLGGTPRPLTTLDAARGETAHGWPVALPGSRHVLFVTRTTARERNRIEAAALDSGKRTLIVEADALVGYDAPWLLYIRAGALLARAFDPASVRISGEPVVVIESVRFEQMLLMSGASVGGNTLTYTPHTPDATRLQWIDPNGRELDEAGQETDVRGLRLDRTGRRAMVARLDRERGSDDIWLLDFAGAQRRRLSEQVGDEDVGDWLPDGSAVLYSFDTEGPYAIVRQETAALSKPATALIEPGRDWDAGAVAPDGRHMLANRSSPAGQALWLVDLADTTKRTEWLDASIAPRGARFSPDGRWVAFATQRNPYSAYIRRIEGGPPIPISPVAAQSVRWGPDGRTVYLVDGSSTIRAVPLTAAAGTLQPGPARQVGTYPTLVDYDVAPDGRLLLALSTSDVRTVRVRAGWRP